jgi:uncharacterized protein YqgC (DUF456 family)
MDATVVMWIVAAVLVAVGLVGAVLPVLPGAPLVLAGLVVAAWAEDFAYVGVPTLILLGVLTALTYVIDLVTSALGAKRVGASKYALWGAVLGGLVGAFFGIPGILLGPFVGAVAGELVAGRSVKQAGKAGVASWIGFLVGTVGKLALLFAMIGVFVVARFV